MNDIIKTIMAWQSVERFSEEQLPEEQLQTILQAGLHAPKASQEEHPFFLVLQNPRTLADLNKLVKDAFFRWNTDESTNEVVLKNKRESSRSNYNFHFKSPTLIVVSGNREYVGAMADSSYALQTIMLAAQSLGISSSLVHQLDWLKDHPSIINFLEELGLPANHIICGSAAFGYRDSNEEPESPTATGLVKIV